jgi:Ca2+-binding RTX toxin-like protein
LGSDIYEFGLGSGLDRISDYDYQSGNNDVLSIGRGVEANQIWLRRVDNDLEVSIIGTGDKTTISNWYYGSTYHIEEFKTSDGKTLIDSQVDALVSAMAGFAPPKAGETTLPANYQSELNAVIAANWK